MQWTEALSVGIDLIDEQHRELIDRINSLVRDVKQGRCRETIGDTIRFLENYAATHFAQEERLMEQHAYPEYSGHKGQHKEFLTSLAELQETLEAVRRRGGGSYELSVTTNQVVVEWILDHIATRDKKLGAFLQNCG
jgi:hemerythrin